MTAFWLPFKIFCYKTFRVILCIICTLFVFVFCQTFWRIDTGLFRFWGHPARVTGVESCPACYGVNMCPEFYSNNLDYYCSHFGSYSWLYSFGVKNVYFACSETYGNVVIKKLGHDSQLHQLDIKICKALGQQSNCNLDKLIDSSFNIQHKIRNVVKYKEASIEDDGFGMILCPNTKNMHKIISPFLLYENETDILNRIILANVWTMLNINPEPVLLKFINNSTTDWPIPTYLGACGRTIIETYEGEMLKNFLSESWQNKAKISLNLLKAANTFTFNNTDFRFYLTDLSLENIVLSANKMWEPIFVDLENVIVVDRHINENDQPLKWKSNHTSEIIECNDCFAFSSESICNHHLSDHNHYAMCKFISEFIFTFIPEAMLKVSPRFGNMIEDCILPQHNMDRFSAVNALIAELQNIIDQSV